MLEFLYGVVWGMLIMFPIGAWLHRIGVLDTIYWRRPATIWRVVEVGEALIKGDEFCWRTGRYEVGAAIGMLCDQPGVFYRRIPQNTKVEIASDAAAARDSRDELFATPAQTKAALQKRSLCRGMTSTVR